MELQFLFDIVCPWAWLAAREVEALAARTGARLVWRPVLLGGILQALGEGERARAGQWSEARRAMGEVDLRRQAALRGAPLVPWSGSPPRTLAAMRLLQATPEERRGPLALRLFEALHVEGVDLSDPARLAAVAGPLGAPLERVEAPETKAALRASTEAAVAEGVFGVPTFRALDRFWWGADRMHLVEAALRGIPSRREAPPELDRDGAAVRSSPGGAPRREAAPGFPPGEVEVFHDLASPYSYLGFSQIERVAAARGATVRMRPFLLGALFKAIGSPEVPIAAMNPSRARYLARDLTDWAAWWGQPFQFPSCFPVRSVLAQRVLLLEPRAAAPLYEALWARGEDISTPETVRRVLLRWGLDPGLVERTEDPAVKARLRANTEAAAARGACGAPTFVVRTEGQLEVVIWGQDRLDLVGACLEGWRPEGAAG